MEKVFTFKGETPVTSPWSNGAKRTRFEIRIDGKGMMEIRPIGKSRVPHFDDVWNALGKVISEVLGDIPETVPEGMKKEKTTAGAYYVGLKGTYIGRSPEGKFTFRGSKKVSVERVQQLLYPLDDFLKEEGVF